MHLQQAHAGREAEQSELDDLKQHLKQLKADSQRQAHAWQRRLDEQADAQTLQVREPAHNRLQLHSCSLCHTQQAGPCCHRSKAQAITLICMGASLQCPMFAMSLASSSCQGWFLLWMSTICMQHPFWAVTDRVCAQMEQLHAHSTTTDCGRAAPALGAQEVQQQHAQALRRLEGLHAEKVGRLTAEHGAEVEAVRIGMRGVLAAEMEAATALHKQVCQDSRASVYCLQGSAAWGWNACIVLDAGQEKDSSDQACAM